MILYEGPSELDGMPIAVIAVGIKQNSSNRKTGAMIQTYIIRSDQSPVEAVRNGDDASICGDCPHRGNGFKQRSCYVNIGQGAQSVYRAYKRGSYPQVDWDVFSSRAIRFGTYGDPAAAPISIWEKLQSLASLTTGYTHQWRNIPTSWRTLVMASADTAIDMRDAQAMGYRTFRVSDTRERGEVLCPASEQAGKKLTCADCGACNGASGRRGSIYIPLHGSSAAMSAKPHFEQRLIARG